MIHPYYYERIWGQKNDIIMQMMDSLDELQPIPIKKLKSNERVYTIQIKHQFQFDEINEQITNAINVGKKNIIVRIEKGLYHFRESHILRKNENAADVSITIEGRGAVITSNDNYDIEGISTNPWREMVQMDTLIEVFDENQKLCFIPYRNTLSGKERTKLTKLQITQWFRAPIYSVSKVDEEGIYFIAPNLSYEAGWYKHEGYNVNFDYLYYGSMPRFRLYDITKESNCSASRFVNLDNCRYRMFNICGIKFLNNCFGAALIGMRGVDAKQIKVSGCTFEYIHGNVSIFNNTGNVVFDHNIVKNTDGNELRFVNNCPNVWITNNDFKNCGLASGQTFCVTCLESEYYIANNTFCDFGYAAIGVGVWHGSEKKWQSKGIIEHNEVFFSQEYFANSWKHMLMDSGAIYVWTQNDGVVIRNNYIHDYVGAGDNRGVFCDDGANNLKIYGNVILNTPNSYSIDSRYIKDQKEGFNNNANNFMANNVVDNCVRFMGYDDENRHVVKGPNMVLKKNSEKTLTNKFEHLEIAIEDTLVNDINSELIKKQIKKCLRH